MIALIRFVLAVLASLIKSKSRLEAENAALRQQLIVLGRKAQGRARLTNGDRWFFVQLYRWFPSILEVLTIVQPETVCVGIGSAFDIIGIGSRAAEAAHSFITSCECSSGKCAPRTRFGVRLASTGNFSNWALRFLNQASPNI